MGDLSKQFIIYGGIGLLVGSTIGLMVSPGAEYPRYGSRWHQWQHWFGNYSGEKAAVRAYIPSYKRAVHVRGLVCRTCGHVDVDEMLHGNAEPVVNEVCGRETFGFTWTDWTVTLKFD